MSFTQTDILMMQRALQIAKLGTYHVKTNPQVGAVITFKDHIIGEGYHERYGGAHAEVNAVNSVRPEDRHLLKESHLYVTLEPCHVHGKTPPCCDLILSNNIPKVTIALEDPNPSTKGKSIKKLRSQGVDVRIGLLQEDAKHLIRKFHIRQTKHRPYIILKWAQSKDGYIGQEDQQVWLSHASSKLLVHRWREEIDAILVGTNTVLVDDPELTNRRSQGRSPLRIILDLQGKIPSSAKVFRDNNYLYFTALDPSSTMHARAQTVYLTDEEWSLSSVTDCLYQRGVRDLLVEGGQQLLNSFMKAKLWDEARVIHTQRSLAWGLKAPMISGKIHQTTHLSGDNIFNISRL